MSSTWSVAALAAALLATQPAAKSLQNDLPLNNGGDVVYVFSTPSVGGPPGVADITGDLYWKAHRGDEVMRSQHPLLGAQMVANGYYEGIYDTDWTTPPRFYMRAHTSALESVVNPGNLEPSFFQLGYLDGPLVDIGASGFGSPCTVAPSLCSPSGSSCAPPGFVNGYLVDLSAEHWPALPEFPMPSDGTPASDAAITFFVRGGMTFSGGTCGMGDYALQDVHSEDETIPDVTGTGISPNTGYQEAGSGPIADPMTHTVEQNETYNTPILNIVADSGGGMGVEDGSNFGGARNAQYLDVSSGAATLAAEVRHHAAIGTGNYAFAASSFSTLPSPGASALGAAILILPDALTAATSSVWQGSVVSKIYYFVEEGVFQGVQVPVPASASGATIYTQGLTINLATLQARSTNVFRTRFF